MPLTGEFREQNQIIKFQSYKKDCPDKIQRRPIIAELWKSETADWISSKFRAPRKIIRILHFASSIKTFISIFQCPSEADCNKTENQKKIVKKYIRYPLHQHIAIAWRGR